MPRLMNTQTHHHFVLAYNDTGLIILVKNPMGNTITKFNVFGTNVNPPDPTDHVHFFERLFELVQARNVQLRTIDLDGNYEELSATHVIFYSFRSHSHVSSIRIYGIKRLPNLLSFCETDHPANGPDECYCHHCLNMRETAYPGLQTLILEGINEKDQNNLFEGQSGRGFSWFKELLLWLEGRKNIGLGPKVVILRFKLDAAMEEFNECEESST